jgi:ketosteroid isomerase-like protein
MRIITLLAFGLFPATGVAQEPAEPPTTPDHVRREIIALGDVVVFNALATTTTTKASGEPLARTQRFTDVLVRRDGRWQLVAGHTSRVL